MSRPLSEAIATAKEEGNRARLEEFKRLLEAPIEKRREAVKRPEFSFLTEDQRDAIIQSLGNEDLKRVKDATELTASAMEMLAQDVQKLTSSLSKGEGEAAVGWRDHWAMPLAAGFAVALAGLVAGIWMAPMLQERHIISTPVLSALDNQQLRWASRFLDPSARDAADWSITPEGIWARKFAAWNGFLREKCPSPGLDKNGGKTCTAVLWDVK